MIIRKFKKWIRNIVIETTEEEAIKYTTANIQQVAQRCIANMIKPYYVSYNEHHVWGLGVEYKNYKYKQKTADLTEDEIAIIDMIDAIKENIAQYINHEVIKAIEKAETSEIAVQKVVERVNALQLQATTINIP